MKAILIVLSMSFSFSLFSQEGKPYWPEGAEDSTNDHYSSYSSNMAEKSECTSLVALARSPLVYCKDQYTIDICNAEDNSGKYDHSDILAACEAQ